MMRAHAVRIRLNKAATFAVVTNVLQMMTVFLLVSLILFTDLDHQNRAYLEFVAALVGFVAIVSATLDIQNARVALQLDRQAKAQHEAYNQLESMNTALRAQRHDFMNHLQVIYSLIEMADYGEAIGYIEKVYGDIQSLGKIQRTAHPAINALLKVKFAECEKKGIIVEVHIVSSWTNLPIEGWEMCRVLGNLLDNAMDALTNVPLPKLTLHLSEDLSCYRFRIHNNGPTIPTHVQELMFHAGYTTKAEGRGMGLYIVHDILHRAGGNIYVLSNDSGTAFEGWIAKSVLGE